MSHRRQHHHVLDVTPGPLDADAMLPDDSQEGLIGLPPRAHTTPISASIRVPGAPVMLALTALGMILAVAALPGRAGTGRQAVEIVAAATIVLGAMLLVIPVTATRRGLTAGVLGLLGSLVYLGLALPAFHRGLTSYPQATLQFVAVLGSITAAGVALALPSPRSTAKAADDLLRDGLVLVAGTILLAIGTGQLARPMLMPPMWQWISFLGLTIPGMLVLVVIRGRAKAGGESASSGRMRLLLVELLLVGGLAIMIYGSTTNLGGVNGFTSGPQGNPRGLALWLGATAFLLVVRSGVKIATQPLRTDLSLSAARRGTRAGRVLVELLYVVGAAGFIYGERAVITGTDPALATGSALPAAAGIVAAAVVLLIPIRLAVKRDARRPDAMPARLER